jgi:hypothetical protein
MGENDMVQDYRKIRDELDQGKYNMDTKWDKMGPLR